MLYLLSTASKDFYSDEFTVTVSAGIGLQTECFNSSFIIDDDIVEGVETLRVEVMETSLAEYIRLGAGYIVDVYIIDDDGKNSFILLQ